MSKGNRMHPKVESVLDEFIAEVGRKRDNGWSDVDSIALTGIEFGAAFAAAIEAASKEAR